MLYKNVDKTFFRFVTNHAFGTRTDRRTAFSWLDRVCRTVKNRHWYHSAAWQTSIHSFKLFAWTSVNFSM